MQATAGCEWSTPCCADDMFLVQVKKIWLRQTISGLQQAQTMLPQLQDMTQQVKIFQQYLSSKCELAKIVPATWQLHRCHCGHVTISACPA